MHGRAMDSAVELVTTYGLRLVGGVLILVGGWIVAVWAAKAVARACQRSEKIDRTLERYCTKVARVVVLIVTAVAILNNFGVQTTTIIAVLGALAVAIGIALKDTLANVASGIMLLVLRPFRVDEVVDLAGTVGTVREVGIFATELETPEGLYVMLPNSQITAGKIVNETRNGKRRIDLVIGIGYRDDAAKAVRIIDEIVRADARVLGEPEPLVRVARLGESAVHINVWPWTKAADSFATKLDLTMRIKERLDAEGISLPFPQREVHIVREVERRAA